MKLEIGKIIIDLDNKYCFHGGLFGFMRGNGYIFCYYYTENMGRLFYNCKQNEFDQILFYNRFKNHYEKQLHLMNLFFDEKMLILM